MSNLDTVHYNVLRILKEDVSSRSSDRRLLSIYYKKYEGIDIDFTSLENPASIIRSRRKIQKLNPALKGAENVELQRDAHSKTYKEFYKNYEDTFEL